MARGHGEKYLLDRRVLPRLFQEKSDQRLANAFAPRRVGYVDSENVPLVSFLQS